MFSKVALRTIRSVSRKVLLSLFLPEDDAGHGPYIVNLYWNINENVFIVLVYSRQLMAVLCSLMTLCSLLTTQFCPFARYYCVLKLLELMFSVMNTDCFCIFLQVFSHLHELDLRYHLRYV